MANMIPISTVTVGSGGAASIDFTGIPQTYTDLVIKLSIRSSQLGAIADYGKVLFNGSTTGYSYKDVYGNGSSAASTGGTTTLLMTYQGNAGTANVFGNSEIYIPNYGATNNKSFSIDGVVENNATTGYPTLTAGLWANTSPIGSISIGPASGTWQQYSTATIYGIRKY
jgi:hypothetical protein